MTSRVVSWMLRVSVLIVAGAVLVLSGLSRAVIGQSSAPFATPPPGSPPAKIRPYGTFAGCPEELRLWYPCAMEKAKTFSNTAAGRSVKTSDGRNFLVGGQQLGGPPQ
jgi:hypothetical protein